LHRVEGFRLNPQTLTALTTNRSHLLATTMNSHAAALLTREWAGKPDPAALTKLGRFRFIAQVTHNGELSEPFALRGIRVEDVAEPPESGGERPLGGAVGRTEAATALQHLEGLDDRILAELERRGGRADTAGDPATSPPHPDAPPAGGSEATREESGLWVPGKARQGQ